MAVTYFVIKWELVCKNEKSEKGIGLSFAVFEAKLMCPST